MACFLWILSRRPWGVGSGGRGSRTRRSVTTGGCFVNYFLRAESDRSLLLTSATGGNEGTGVKKKAKIGVQTESAKKDDEHEEKEEEEEERVGGDCDCLALTFASHILPSCQWHSTGEFFGRHRWFLCSRTETRYYFQLVSRFGSLIQLYRHAKMYVRTMETWQ